MYYVRITMAYGILRLKIKHHKYTPWSQKTQFLILLFSKLKFKRYRKFPSCAASHTQAKSNYTTY